MAKTKNIRYNSQKPGSSDGRNSAWSWTMITPNYIARPTEVNKLKDNKWKLKSVTLTLTRIKNSNRAIKFLNQGGAVVPAGQVKSSNIKVKLKVGSHTTNELTITSGPTELQGTGGYNYYSDRYSWCPASKQYTFKFSDVVKITKNTKVQIIISGTSGNKGGISVGWGEATWKNCYWTVEEIESPPKPDPPKPPTPTGSTVHITDLTGASKGGDVLDDYIETVSYSGCDTIFKGGSGSGAHSAATSVTRSSITVKATDSNTDYPTVDNFSVAISCGHNETRSYTDSKGNVHTYTVYVDTSFSVPISSVFYEKIQREEGTVDIYVNARDAADQIIDITEYDYGTAAAKAHNAWKYPKQQDLGEFIIEDNNAIPLNQYFSLTSDSSNIHKIAEDYQSVPYLFRFYNSDVQTAVSDRGTYKKDLTLNWTIRFAPNDRKQFSYEFWDRYNNVVSENNLPEIFLMDQEEIMVANLRYENYDDAGGYCRAFRITFRDYNTKQVYVQYDLESLDSFSGTWPMKIMEHQDYHYQQLPYGVIMELVIEPYFHFDDSPHTMYSDLAIVIPQLWLKQKDEDVIPKLFFPILSKSEPWTPMMLPNVERFGYYFETIISDNWKKFKTKFGINIGGYDLFLEEEEYWTNREVVRHMIINMGKFVTDHSMFEPDLQIRPFIITMYNTPQAWRDYAPSNNSVLCTTQDSMWRKPIATKGEYLRYFDAERFMQFINKYRPLNNYEMWTVPTELRGYIIDTDFWIQKANQSNSNYVEPMKNWLYEPKSGATNDKPCWVETKFIHKKGEYFFVKGTPTTHDYLHEAKYTHNFLHQFTHDYIKNNLATVNNMKENYYDILTGLSFYQRITNHNY